MRLITLLACSLAAAAETALPVIAPGTVVIPTSEYTAMVEQAERAAKALANAPRPYSIHGVEFRLEAATGLATGSVEIRGDVAKSGPVIVPVAAGMNVRGAQVNGAPAAITLRDGRHALIVQGPAEFTALLRISLPVASETGRASLTIPAVSAGIVKAGVTIPGEDATVQIAPGVIESRQSNGGRSTAAAILVPGKPSILSWNARQSSPSAPAQELLFFSNLKTLAAVEETGVRLEILGDVTVVRGEAPFFDLDFPVGFEVTGVTGATLSSHAVNGQRIRLTVASGRSHQFLVTLERPAQGTNAGLSLPSFLGAQRESGELLIEAEGAVELAAKEAGSLRRMDLREVNPQLRSLSRASLQSAFRYTKRPGEAATVALEWVRFPAAPITAAVASRASATTIVTREGRTLTEIRLTVQNQSQAFVRTLLPPGSTILTAEVAGEKVKPVEAPDGSRLPLLRPGFRPTGPYMVSFVTQSTGSPFAKRGNAELRLPQFDMPAAALSWEVFLPEELRASGFGGDAVPAERLQPAQPEAVPLEDTPSRVSGYRVSAGGSVIDATGAPVGQAAVTVTGPRGDSYRAIASSSGTWSLPSIPAGRLTIRAEAPGFRSTIRQIEHFTNSPLRLTLRLEIGSVSETIEISAADTRKESRDNELVRQSAANSPRQDQDTAGNAVEFQRRLSGILPVSITIPRTGNSHRFVRTLLTGEETRLTFQYRTGK